MDLPCPHHSTISQVPSNMPVGQIHMITALQFFLLPFLINNFIQAPPPERSAKSPLHIGYISALL